VNMIRAVFLTWFVELIPTAAIAQTIVWTDQNARRIQRKDVNGGAVETIIQFPSGNSASTIHYDPIAAKLYYELLTSGSFSFQRANLDGTNPETIPTPSTGGFTLNVDSRKLYWSSGSSIYRSELDGSGVDSHTYPTCCVFALEAFGDDLFFGAGGTTEKGIWRADADGSNEQFLHESGGPLDLAYDTVESKLYVAALAVIFRMNLDGTDFEQVVSLPSWQLVNSYPTQIVVDVQRRKMYWADQVAKVIQRSNLDGSDVEDFVTVSDVGNPNFDIVGLTIVYSSTPVPEPDGAKGRALSFIVPVATATGPSGPTAIRVSMVDLQNPVPPNLPSRPPPDFSAYEAATCTAAGEAEGCARWVGKPSTFLESQNVPVAGNFKAARLQCTPLYHDFASEGLFQVVGAEIVPSSSYDVQVYDPGCPGDETSCSWVVRMTTRRYGDVAAEFNPPSGTTQPDAIDVAQLVNKFKNLTGAPSKSASQVQPNVPELNADVNALDIAGVVDAVKGSAYPFSGPCPCPSPAACGAVACTSATACADSVLPGLGPGAMCVRTCDGGDNADEPCLMDAHCPGSACGGGFCRDRCGRCTP